MVFLASNGLFSMPGSNLPLRYLSTTRPNIFEMVCRRGSEIVCIEIIFKIDSSVSLDTFFSALLINDVVKKTKSSYLFFGIVIPTAFSKTENCSLTLIAIFFSIDSSDVKAALAGELDNPQAINSANLSTSFLALSIPNLANSISGKSTVFKPINLDLSKPILLSATIASLFLILPAKTSSKILYVAA